MTTNKVPSDLESSLRNALAWYPKAWRAQNLEVLLAIMMEAYEEQDARKLRKSDFLELIALGIWERMFPFCKSSGLGKWTSRFGLIFSLFYVFYITWTPDSIPGFGISEFSNPEYVTGTVLVVAWLFTELDRRKTAVFFACCAFLSNMLISMASNHFGWYGPSGWVFCAFATLPIGLLIQHKTPKPRPA